MLHIVKIGGQVIEDKVLLAKVLDDFVALPGNKLLVHGGGRRASELSRRLGIEPQMHEGRRITGDGDLEVAVMVYAGLANKTLVASLQARGCEAIGLSGADGNVLWAHRRPVRNGIDYGWVGDIDAVNVDFIDRLFDGGYTPVFCAITHDGHGQLLNTNADTIAARLAEALALHHEVHLRFCFEKPGVLLDPNDDRSLIDRLDPLTYEHYRNEGIISGGMLPKLDNAFRALQEGVREVVICSPENLVEGGTVLHL